MIPICCITYNRKGSLERLLTSLDSAYYDEPVTLIISIDKSDSDEIERFSDSFKWKHGEKRVLKHEVNLGLRKHILSCGELLNEFEALIVLEDDISISPSFYYYAKQCVEKYKDDNQCAGISLYNFPLNYHNHLPFVAIHSNSDVYKMYCAQSWGQVWMKQQWFDFIKWYKEHDEEFSEQPHLPRSICNWPKSSWLKYHTKYCIEQEKYFIYPYISLSTNNGDAGTHAVARNTAYQVPLLLDIKESFVLNPSVVYDVFFENKDIAVYLGLERNEVCVDLYGEKNNRENRRYWLTLKKVKKYKIVKSFGLDFKPWDTNILMNNSGRQVFLYDTLEPATNNFDKTDAIWNYIYPINRKHIVILFLCFFRNFIKGLLGK